MNRLRVLIVATDPLARTGLAALLTMQDDIEIVGQAGALGEELLLLAPDLVLWDLGWDAAAAYEAHRLGALRGDRPPIVALLADSASAALLRAAGIEGLLLRDAARERLVAALAAVAQGLLVIDPALAAAPSFPAPAEAEQPHESLTAREIEVLGLISEGLSNKAIAQRLQISDHTVKFHVNAILEKLGAQSRTDAVVRAVRMGLITL